MKKLVTVIFASLLAYFFYSLFFKSKDKSRELSRALEDNAVLIDVRTPQEFQAGSVPTAINIPLQEFPQHIDELKELDQIVVFCRTGNRSGQAKKMLNDTSYEPVLNGGAWTSLNELYKQVHDQ